MNTMAQPGQKKSVALSGIVAGNTAVCTVGRTRQRSALSRLRYSRYRRAMRVRGNRPPARSRHLPTAAELAAYKAKLKTAARPCPPPASGCLRLFRASAHPMDVMRTGVSFLGCVAPEEADHNHAGARDIADRLMASLGSMLLYWYHYAHNGRVIEVETDDDEHRRRIFSTFCTASRRRESWVRAMHTSLNLYAEHEFNASTFTGRIDRRHRRGHLFRYHRSDRRFAWGEARRSQ